MATLPHNCDRARAWISLRLDGELSEFEGLMLGAHVERCAACRAFAADAAGFTAALRAAPLESLERRVTAIARRRPLGRRAVQLGAAAALVAASAGLGSIFGAVGSGSSRVPSPAHGAQPTPIFYPAPIKYAKPLGVRDVRPAIERVTRRGLRLTDDAF